MKMGIFLYLIAIESRTQNVVVIIALQQGMNLHNMLHLSFQFFATLDTDL